jgi:hypothetical protein
LLCFPCFLLRFDTLFPQGRQTPSSPARRTASDSEKVAESACNVCSPSAKQEGKTTTIGYFSDKIVHS